MMFSSNTSIVVNWCWCVTVCTDLQCNHLLPRVTTCKVSNALMRFERRFQVGNATKSRPANSSSSTVTSDK